MLGQVHAAQMSPERRDCAAMKPVQVSKPAVQANSEKLSAIIFPAPAVPNQPRTPGVQGLHQDFPNHQKKECDGPARHPAAEQTQGPFDVAAGVLDIAALENQLAQFAL